MKKSAIILTLILLVSSCAVQKQKLSRIRSGETPAVQLTLGKEQSYLPEIEKPVNQVKDTLRIKEDDGREIFFMKAIKDEESGEMVAADVLDAAMVTARFRNVAERKGKVNLAFQVIVPKAMMDSRWQLRFYPDLFVMEDSLRLEPVIITGSGYRKAQLRGYQQYARFLSKIVTDTTKFIDVRNLEIFLERHIPQIYAFKTDSSFVSDESFQTIYGVTEQQAIEHYTNQFAVRMNERRKARKAEMYRKYIKAPIVSEGIRLDTVIVTPDGDFIYDYVQTINTRPRLRKADVVLSGDIFEQDKRLYQIPRTEPLTFYISSVSALANPTVKYLSQVIYRKASAETECHIDFEQGKSQVNPNLGDNAIEISRIEKVLGSLIENEEFDLDSVLVNATASPEGSLTINRNLAQSRSSAVSRYFNNFMNQHLDSLRNFGGFSISESGSVKQEYSTIAFTPRFIPENWEDLDDWVRKDIVMDDGDKESYFSFAEIKDLDLRESKMKTKRYYPYLNDVIYPRLRTVKFHFFLSRKGMVQDTIQTTVIDSTYMRGLAALQDMDYATALLLLKPYEDINTAIAYVGLDRNANALNILREMKPSPEVNYLLAILYSRLGDDEKAVDCYLRSCRENRSYIYRGNLDPEISVLIKRYELHKENE